MGFCQTHSHYRGLSGCTRCAQEARDSSLQAIVKKLRAQPGGDLVIQVIRLTLSSVAENIRENEREPDVYYGSEIERAKDQAHNEAIRTIANAIEVEITKLEE